jgi:hypothetical protein
MGMNLIDNQHASTTSGQPWTPVQDIDFLQYGIRDVSAAIIESLIGSAYDPATSYIIKGCVKSSSAGTTSITAGYIFGIAKALGSMVARTYLYTVAAQSFPDPAGLDVVVANVTAFNPVYDPVTFSDGATHSIHNEWRVVFSTGASGSGDVDFDDLVVVNVPRTVIPATGTDWGLNTPNPRYEKDYTGTVRLSGAFKALSTTPSADFGIIPIGYRPTQNYIFTGVVLLGTALTFSVVAISVSASTGVMSFANTSDIPNETNSLIFLDQITYK